MSDKSLINLLKRCEKRKRQKLARINDVVCKRKWNDLELPVLLTSRLNIVPGGFPFKLADIMQTPVSTVIKETLSLEMNKIRVSLPPLAQHTQKNNDRHFFYFPVQGHGEEQIWLPFFSEKEVTQRFLFTKCQENSTALT